MADKSGVVHLNGSNYATWKIQIKMALIKYGGWGFVTGTEPEPAEGDAAAWRKYYERQDKALATIVLAVEPSLLYLLGDPQDPAEVWHKLSDQFEKKSWANKLALRRKLYSLRLKENESVQKHIKSMIEIFESLSVIGHVVEEEDRVVHILASLPDSFQMLVTALEANPEVPKLEVVLERLQNEEKKLLEKSAADQQNKHPENALIVKSRNGPICFYCGKNGHVKKFCEELRKKQEEEEMKSKKEKEESSFFCYQGKPASQFNDSDDDIDCIALVSHVTSLEHKKKDWVVDSAANFHMCNNPSLMRNIRPLNEKQYIKVGNGEYVEAKDEGTVKVEIKAGGVVRKFLLQNVLLAPELQYNLLSVAKVAAAGKTVEFGRHGCRIIDCSSRKTLGSGQKKGNLYYLNIVKREVRNSQKYVECDKSLNSKEMKKALEFVSENSFERELMKRLERMENKIVSNTIKEEKHLNQEDKQHSLKNKKPRENNCRRSEVQEDKKQIESNEKCRTESIQEDNEIQKLLDMDLVNRETRGMSVQEFLRKQNEDQKSESEIASEVLASSEDQISTDQTMYQKKVDHEKEQIATVKAIETSTKDYNNNPVKDREVKRCGGFVKKLSNLRKFLSGKL